jgi:hypothetical protein
MEMTPATFGRQCFACEQCREFLQLLDVREPQVPSPGKMSTERQRLRKTALAQPKGYTGWGLLFYSMFGGAKLNRGWNAGFFQKRNA